MTKQSIAGLFLSALVGMGVQQAASATTSVPIPKPSGAERKAASAKAATKKAATPARVNRNAVAKTVFARAKVPANLKARAIGSYARGCLAGGTSLAADGPSWQVIRLSRNRNWGHPAMVKYLERLAADVPAIGWRGLLVGDMAQPRGGPMPKGHSSHQIGLDADIWLREMPKERLTRQQREKPRYVSMVRKGTKRINKNVWTDDHAKLLRRAASDKQVARIFVNAAIKKALCDWAKGDRSWLRKVRPWYGHDYHFHVRLSCPKGLAGCKNQAAPPAGDGCGKSLAWWLKPEVKQKKTKKKKTTKVKKRREIRVADLPQACTGVLAAQ